LELVDCFRVSANILIQEHVALGEIRFCCKRKLHQVTEMEKPDSVGQFSVSQTLLCPNERKWCDLWNAL